MHLFMPADISPFIKQVTVAAQQQLLIKITLGNRFEKTAELKNVFVKPVVIKNVMKLSFVYRYPTKDITRNFDLEEGITQIEQLLQHTFLNADVFSSENDIHFAVQKNGSVKITAKPASLKITQQVTRHDKEKVRIVPTIGKYYLHALGITTAEGLVKKDKQDKYRQINRYVEIIEGIIKDIHFEGAIQVADMGSGKGYLTFALYDYLTCNLRLDASVTGIELREELVSLCNKIAHEAGYNKLTFKSGTIEHAELGTTDMMLALHACDTATDEAIYKGIQANARVIVCAPCCHKQIRKQMAPENELKSITKHGILLERQAEITTDAIRALLLEANGYKSKVFEFIATEHTPKNVLIVGIKQGNPANPKNFYLDKVAALKSVFGIQNHQLETLLNGN